VGLLDYIHGDLVFGRRIETLARHFAEMIPRDSTVLDIGCGDGQIDRMLMDRRPDLRIEGIDVLLRPTTHIPVTLFDGRTIPHADRSIDVITFVDVLHHTDDPMVLLREAARVARKCVVIKDHTMDGPLADSLLRVMDWFGNARHGVRLPYNYWSSSQWARAFAELHLHVAEDRRDLGLYIAPLDVVFGRGLHLIARLDVAHA
jgi:ubiquinone/menaquinone biosynthesis C-methylase UbiE